MLAYYDSRAEVVASECTSSRFQSSRNLSKRDGLSRRQCSNLLFAGDLLAMAMQIPPTFLRWFAVPKCESRRHVPSIELCARLTASASAPSRKSVPSANHRNLPESRRSFLHNL